ncbi:MAG: hypothetical protein H6741_20650 [Alphaproteobacteria bacterium]|nr:hypothetical protein [Alphaproteobacteria bacterium]MCB9795119.1 hypothetical protein [Alphaproteobacteria bacterium]
MRPALLSLLAALLLLLGAQAQAAGELIRLRDADDATLLASVVDGTWSGTWQRHTYDDRLFQEVRLAEIEEGYLPMIRGEGGQDVPQAVIAEVIYRHFDQLPQQSSWVKHVENLGEGFDPVIGAPYVDTYFHLDSVFMYVAFTWRVYRGVDAQGRDVLWFEKLQPEAVDAATWRRYQGRVAVIQDQLAGRWVGNAVVEPEEVYGVFVVEPGERYESRVTFVANLTFASEDSWLAAYATKLPFVLRMAVGEVFEAAVKICVARMG